MAYLVSLASRAQRDLVTIYEYIHAQESAKALRWYEGLKKAILGLEELPNRCPISPENKRLRQLLYGRKPHVYRIFFRVQESRKRVDVIHIRHGARRRFMLK
jgi:toxin ParE1/3/4